MRISEWEQAPVYFDNLLDLIYLAPSSESE